MKKLGDKLRLFVCLPLVLICALFAVSNITTLSFSSPISVAAVTNSNDTTRTAYHDFLDTVTQMLAEYDASNNALIFFDKDTDLSTDGNGNYLVTEQTFVDLTCVVPNQLTTSAKSMAKSRAKSEPVYNLRDLATQTGFNVTNGEQNMILTRPFATKRLIIQSTTTDLDLCGAVAAARYADLHIHQYDTETAASEAYNYYLTRQDVMDVGADSLCWVENAFTNADHMMPLGFGDPFSYQSWGVDTMGVGDYARYLSDIIRAVNNDFSTLPQVTVAVIDTGIDTDHEWFANRLLVDENGKYVGKDYTKKDSSTAYDFEDDQGHGTHCAGIICDMTMSNVKILPIKFMKMGEDGKATGSTLSAIFAIDYVMELRSQYNIVAINMSFGSESDSTTQILDKYLASKIQEAYDDGIFSVAAAGNDHVDASGHSPANVDCAITVSALNQMLELASYSNYGDCVDVCAPGSSILSACYDGGLIYKDGTSMATPHVAAYIALLKSDPTHDYSMTDIEQILTGTYDGFDSLVDLGDAGKDPLYGYGMPTLTHATPDYIIIDAGAGSHGTISPSGYNLYLKDENDVTVTFTPDEGYHVSAVYVEGYLVHNSNGMTEYTFDRDTNHMISVLFTANPYTVTIEAGEHGTVLPQVGVNEVNLGDDFVVTFQPDHGYHVAEVIVDGQLLTEFDSTGYTFTNLQANHQLTVNFAPNRYTITATVGDHGIVLPLGETEVSYQDELVFTIIPEQGYHLGAVLIDGVATEFESMTQYTLTNISESHAVMFEFEADVHTAYKVNHYWESIYDLNDTENPHEFILHESETLYGPTGTATAAEAKTYLGFTAPTKIEQKYIDYKTEINIYYTRNVYTLNVKAKGFERIDGVGKYLYGATVELLPMIHTEYDWLSWSIEACDDQDFIQDFDIYNIEPTFNMPASDLTLRAYASIKTFVIRAKAVGKGTITPEYKTVSYGGSVNFNFTPADGYMVKTVYLNGEDLGITDTSYTMYTITSATELTVVFDKSSNNFFENVDWTSVVIWGGGSLIAVIMFGSSAVMLFISFHGRKSYAPKPTANKTKKKNKTAHVIAPENRLLVALEFITGRESDFISFCTKHHIDYKTQYRQAIIKFYDAHHQN